MVHVCIIPLVHVVHVCITPWYMWYMSVLHIATCGICMYYTSVHMVHVCCTWLYMVHVCVTPWYMWYLSVLHIGKHGTCLCYTLVHVVHVCICHRHVSRRRLTVHEALEHSWLAGDYDYSQHRIPSSRYNKIRETIRQRYVSTGTCSTVDPIEAIAAVRL